MRKREVKVENIIIELEELPRFFKFEAGKTYEVEIDLQRFPIIGKFKNRNGEEYPACIFNLRIIKEDNETINSEWMVRRIGVGDYREDREEKRIKPRIGSELWQLVRIYLEYGAGIHRCIVKTRKGNQGQVLVRYTHSNECECLKKKKKREEKAERAEELHIHHPQEIAERIKEEIEEERAITIKEVTEKFNTDEEIARKALEILEKEGLAVKIREDKYYFTPK